MTEKHFKQFKAIKDKHSDCIVLMKIEADYYAFNADAETLRDILGTRIKEDAARKFLYTCINVSDMPQYVQVPMFVHCMSKLIDKGHQLAVSENEKINFY